MIFLAGPETNRWAQRNGRMYLRAKDYFPDFEKVYGASGVLPSLDGADHFRLRKSMQSAYSRGRLMGQLDQLDHYARTYMADWTVGDSLSATNMCRRMINAQISPISVSVDSQDIIEDMMKYKERALTHPYREGPAQNHAEDPGNEAQDESRRHLAGTGPGCPYTRPAGRVSANLADDKLSLYASDPQLVPESNLRFALSAALIASVYLGDAF